MILKIKIPIALIDHAAKSLKQYLGKSYSDEEILSMMAGILYETGFGEL